MLPHSLPDLPSYCVLCDRPIRRAFSLCKECEDDLPKILHACKLCGIPLNESSRVCGQCLKTKPVVDFSLSLYHYESPVDYLISQLKFRQKLSYAAILGHLLSEHLLNTMSAKLPDAIIPVPLYKKRLGKRGFNQSLEIAKIVSKKTGLTIDTQLVSRKKSTRAQSSLHLKQRKQNVKDCFQIKNQNQGAPVYERIAILDDVVTTGATTNELAKVLKTAGIKKVGVWSIGRAVLHGNNS